MLESGVNGFLLAVNLKVGQNTGYEVQLSREGLTKRGTRGYPAWMVWPDGQDKIPPLVHRRMMRVVSQKQEKPE